MYVLRTNGGHAMLTEMSLPILRKCSRTAPEGWSYRIVSGQYAHKWVQDGGLHDTPLWVNDNGKVRRASDNNY